MFGSGSVSKRASGSNASDEHRRCNCIDRLRARHRLDVPGTPYYPSSVQGPEGRIYIFAHVGGDNPYGKVDQSITMDTFRLKVD